MPTGGGLHESVLCVRAMAPATITTDTNTDSTTDIDTGGYDEACVAITFGACSGGTITMTLLDSATAGSGHAAMVTGPSSGAVTAANALGRTHILRWKCDATRKRFVRVRFTTASATSYVVESVISMRIPNAATSFPIVSTGTISIATG